MTVQTQNIRWRDRWAYGLFWSWNIIFVAFMVLGFAPRILPELLVDVRAGLIPVNYLIYGLVLTAVPVVAIILGLTVLRRAPARLFALGYVVEGPLMAMLAIRFFVIRQAPPSMTFLMTVAGLGMATFLWVVLDPDRDNPLAGSSRLVGLTLMLLTSLYTALWIAFYAVPLTAFFFQWLGLVLGDIPQFLHNVGRSFLDIESRDLIWIPLSVLSFLLGTYTATLFVLAPIAVPVLTIRAWRRIWQVMRQNGGRLVPAGLVTLTVVVTGILFVLSNRQPQKQAFALLERPPANLEQAQALLKKRESIRAGLLNAYLSPFRYISSVGEVTHVRYMYQDAFHMEPQRARQVQAAYEYVARPLLYVPVHPDPATDVSENSSLRREPREADRLYRYFFDMPIIEGERPVIINAVRSTWSADQAETAWQAVDDREVHLARQEVTIQEHGDWADVELMETYQNRTYENQEVIYFFNLPESAVITGLWLGNTPDRDSAFAFQVAPRGAAQAVYREQTRQMRDPALIEQIGPRQYRLRAYPVLPLVTRWDETTTRRLVEEAPPLYLWLTYRTMRAGEDWPLPHLAYKHNIYWDEDTQRTLNGSAVQVDEESWMPEDAPAMQISSLATHRVDFPDGTSLLVTPATQVGLPELPSNARLAVVLDRSGSMRHQNDQVDAALARLEQVSGDPAGIDLFLTASPYRGEGASLTSLTGFDSTQTVYFGGQNAAQLLAQFGELRGERIYDGILVLTDGSGYELGEGWIEVPIPDAPIWLVHLGSDIPLGYDDRTLQAIQASGGGVTGDIDQALQRLAISLAGPDSGEIASDVLDGYVWSRLPAADAQAAAPEAVLHSGEDAFMALAARRLILAEISRQRGTIDTLETLDWLHALAQQYGIVTPYSSMIVLVDQQQQELLENLEQLDDRYEREVEDLGDTAPATQTPLTGVPEPEEWLLLGLAALLLVWYTNRQRLAMQTR